MWKLSFFVFITFLGFTTTEASIGGFIVDLFASNKSEKEEIYYQKGLQSISILESEDGLKGGVGGADITIENNTLVSDSVISPGIFDDRKESEHISVYEVRKGDTLGEIAEMFNVSINTIRWANDINGSLKTGQIITILPVSGIEYSVKKGDTINSIAKKYKADVEEIKDFNDITDSSLIIGQVIIIPDAEAPQSTSSSIASSNSSSKNISGYFIRPIKGGVRTQGVHGHNGVDLASYAGAPILASADGEVIIAKSSGWNGGYGSYVVIKHSNGTQTLYAHLSDVNVYAGKRVYQGDTIGTMGNTGKSTGVHLHFEIRGAKNPF